MLEDIEVDDSTQKAYICPNPGSNANLASKKQRLIFVNIDRNDSYSILDAGKICDLMVVVMSCKHTNVKNLKQDPFIHAKAIDEVGYKALSLIRSQGMVSLVGCLQHLEMQSTSKHGEIKRLFKLFFESEFTSKYKFMHINASNETTLYNDSNALLRQIAV